MQGPAQLSTAAAIAAWIALLGGCSTDPQRSAYQRPERATEAEVPEEAPVVADRPEFAPRGTAPRTQPGLRRVEARPPRPAVTAATMRRSAPPGGVTSIDVGAASDHLQLLVAQAGALRILERSGETFEDVAELRLPAIEGVERVVSVPIGPDRAAILLIAAGTIRVLGRDPDGTYIDQTDEVMPGTRPTGVTWLEAADLDADGDIDLFAAAAGGVRILENDGQGRLVDRTDAYLPADPPPGRRVFPFDIDEDQDVDLVIVDPEVHVLINDDRGRFVDETAFRLPDGPRHARTVLAFDADDDFDTDIVLLRGDEPDLLWRNDGRGRLMPAPDEFMPSARALEGVRLDIDDDGSLDLATVGADGLVLRLVEDGRRVRTDDWRLPADVPTDAREIAAIDVDLDGDQDLVLGRPGGLTILIDDGRGSYVDASVIMLPRPEKR